VIQVSRRLHGNRELLLLAVEGHIIKQLGCKQSVQNY